MVCGVNRHRCCMVYNDDCNVLLFAEMAYLGDDTSIRHNLEKHRAFRGVAIYYIGYSACKGKRRTQAEKRAEKGLFSENAPGTGKRIPTGLCSNL